MSLPAQDSSAAPHRFQLRVFYEDTDMAGIVYYANYLRFIERARSDWVRGIGIDQSAMKAEGVVFVVRRVVADYVAPAVFEDLLEVRTSLQARTPARMILQQEVVRGDDTIFRAEVTIVCLGPVGKPVRLPAKLRSMHVCEAG